ncbi:MAG: hypothetical protein KatS3mg010_0434 [Acidimicrobiia bacterium]|nr:MAG: hypothetical protein KatS3mg010_0434 [Acidimicrobiia bacterium]
MRSLLLHGHVESEHRIATVAFLGFTGVDGLVAARGPEHVAIAVDQLVRTVQENVDDEGVAFLATDIDADGGKVILVSGVPGMQEDDEGRILRAARRIIDTPHELAIRIGINRGHVFAGEVGTPFRATYTVMGDTVNLAARLMSAAGPGEVYAAPDVLDRSRTRFHAVSLEPFTVKGKAEPVHAFAVGGETGTNASTLRDDLEFLGRDAELERLRAAMLGDDPDNDRVVTVVGDPGIGKTRLVQEAIARLRDVAVLEIRAEPYAMATPYRALRDPVRSLLGVSRAGNDEMARATTAALERVAPHLVEFAPLLGDVVQVDIPSTLDVEAIDPRFRRDRLADVLIEVFEQLWTAGIVFVVDDAHWLDDASSHLLARISEATIDHRFALAVTRQRSGGGFLPERGPTIDLGPLSDEFVSRLLLTATAATPLHPDEIDAVVARVAGNPLFLEEMVRAMRRSGSAHTLPETLEAVVGAQVDALPPLARNLLRYAAVLGRSFSVALADRVLAAEGVRLDAATTGDLAEFLEADGAQRYRFRHPMVRDVAYESLPYRRRRSLHLRAGEAAEALAGDDVEPVADVLSLHFSLAQEHAKTWRYACIAAARAKAAYANVEAATQYERALDAARRLPDVDDAERGRLWEQLGDVRDLAGRYEAALDAYRRALRLSGPDRIRRAELLLKRARAREQGGAFSVALRDLTAGMRELEGLDSPRARAARARLLSYAALVYVAQERSREARSQAERAIIEARRVGELEALARALEVADYADFTLDGSSLGRRMLEAVTIYEQLGEVAKQGAALANLGFLASNAGRWDEAVGWFTRARPLYERCGDLVGSAIVDSNLGEILVNQWRLHDAEPLLERASHVMRSAGYVEGAAYADMQLARVWCESGRLDEAQHLLKEVAAEFAALGKSASALEAAVVQAEVALRTADPFTALDLLADAERCAGHEAAQFTPRIAHVRVRALVAAGRLDDARRELRRGLAVARRRQLAVDEQMLSALEREVGDETAP